MSATERADRAVSFISDIAEDGYNVFADAVIWLEDDAPKGINIAAGLLLMIALLVVTVPVGLIARLAGRAVAR